MEKRAFPFRIEYIFMLIAAFFWALGHPLGKIVLRTVHPFQLGAVNLIAGFLSLLIYLTLAGRLRDVFKISRYQFFHTLPL